MKNLPSGANDPRDSSETMSRSSVSKRDDVISGGSNKKVRATERVNTAKLHFYRVVE